MMRIGVGADHLGVALRATVESWCEQRQYVVHRYGAEHCDDETDYPDVAIEVATAIRSGILDRGILLCATGIGMAISANKVKGVRAATVSDPYSAERSRASNDVQVVALGALVVGTGIVPHILAAWFDAAPVSARYASWASLQPTSRPTPSH
jgi:ribose 5-phosphate isomerase B